MFNPITWRISDPVSGGLGDHGLTMIALLTLALFASIYYYKHDKKGIIKSLFFGVVDAWLVIVLISMFFITMSSGIGNAIIIFLLPGTTLYTPLLMGGTYMIFVRWILLGRGLKDIAYTGLVMALYAPFIVFWQYGLGGAKFSALVSTTNFNIALWEVSLGLYICFLYYVIVVRRLN